MTTMNCDCPINIEHILVLSADSFIGIRFSISRKVITHLIHSSGHPSLKMASCQEYLKPQAGLSGSMRNSNLIQSDLSVPAPSILSIFFTLGTKGMVAIGEGGVSLAQKEARQQRIWKNYSWPFPGLKFFNRNKVKVLYVERTIAVYDLF
jgi:hypothetical protein